MGKTPELNKRITYRKKMNSKTLKTEGSDEEQKPYLMTNQQQSKFTKNSSFIKSINVSHHLPTEEKIVSKKPSIMLPLEVHNFIILVLFFYL